MIYARLSPELLLDMEPLVAHVRTATCMVRVAKDLRVQAEQAELIAIDHMKAACAAMTADLLKLYPDLEGQPYYFDAATGEIIIRDNSVEVKS